MNTYSLSLSRSSGQYVDLGDVTPVQITGDLTIEGWIKLNNAATASTIVSKDNRTNKRAYLLIYNEGLGKIQFQYSSDGNNMNVFTSNNSPSLNTWVHVAATFSSSNRQVTLYINGVQDFQSAAGSSDSIHDVRVSAKIGADGDTTLASLLDGLIDDVRIWNIVRSASDIANNYQRELAGNENGLAAYLKFDNNYNDATGNTSPNPSGTPSFSPDVPFTDSTTTSTSTTTTSTSTTTTSTSTSTTTTTSTSTSTSTTTTSTSTSTSTSTTTTQTSTSTTTTSTSTTTTSTSTTTTSTSTTTTTSTSTSTTITIGLRFMVEKVR